MMARTDRLGHGLATLSVCLLFAFSWYGFGQASQVPGPRDARVHLVLEGRHYRVPEPRMQKLRARSSIWLREGGKLVGQRSERRLEEGMEALFLPVERRIPDFLDWYYSFRGEYTRLGGWALEKLGLEGRSLIVDRTDELLFEATDFRQRLAVLERELSGNAQQAVAQSREGWQRMMRTALSAYEVPPPLNRRGEPSAPVIDLDALDKGVAADERVRLANRMALSSAGGVVTGALVWRAATRAAVATGGRAAAARGAGRVASRAGSAALAGLGLCGVTGPAAVGCGLVAGAAAWVSIDWAMIEADEWANRDDLEKRLRQGLTAVRNDLEQDMADALREQVEQLNRAQRTRIRRTLTPLDTIKKAATQGGGQTEHG